MRDEIDGRMWETGHDQLSRLIDDAISGIGAKLRSNALPSPEFPARLLSSVAAFGITALTFGGTAA